VRSAAESLLWYSASRGYDDYNGAAERAYTPLFDVRATAEQRRSAARVCTLDGLREPEPEPACQYDFYRTGNSVTAASTAATALHYSSLRHALGNATQDTTQTGHQTRQDGPVCVMSGVPV